MSGTTYYARKTILDHIDEKQSSNLALLRELGDLNYFINNENPSDSDKREAYLLMALISFYFDKTDKVIEFLEKSRKLGLDFIGSVVEGYLAIHHFSRAGIESGLSCDFTATTDNIVRLFKIKYPKGSFSDPNIFLFDSTLLFSIAFTQMGLNVPIANSLKVALTAWFLESEERQVPFHLSHKYEELATKISGLLVLI